jgi:hypothetical protein
MSAIEVKVSDNDLTYLESVAEERHCSVAEVASRVIADAAKAQREWNLLMERAERGKEVSLEEYRAILAKAPDVPPMPGDELPEGWKQTEK